MSTPLSRVITNEIFRVPARRKRKPDVKPSDIPTLKGYTARLVDQKWLPSQQGGHMANLCKAARGRECQVRIPGVCNGNPETSVLAHYRLAGTCGTGCKPDDTQGAIACSACHDLIDGRKKTTDYTRDELRLMHAEGVLRTLAIWKQEGLLKA